MPRKKAADTSPLIGEDSTLPTISKADAVRAVLEEGVEKPKEGVARIREKFGLELTSQQFSQYKTLGKKKANGGVVRLSPRTAPASGNGYQAPAGGLAGSVEAIKKLVDSLGADEVVKIAELFRR